jgi:hypothetical protein
LFKQHFAFTPPVRRPGDTYDLVIAGRQCTLRPIADQDQSDNKSSELRFWVADWIQARFGVRRPGALPVWATDADKQRKEMRSRLTGAKYLGEQAVVLFTPQSRWEAMQSGYEASNYADDLNAALAEGESGETWFAVDTPQRGEQVPVWAADLYCATKRIHDLVRF